MVVRSVRVARAGKVQRLALFTLRTSELVPHTPLPHIKPSHHAPKTTCTQQPPHCTTVKLARLKESPIGMDPPSPSKFPMSPGMPLFPVSPERAAGTKPLYGAPSAAQSPSLPDLRLSPLRKHRRNDSDVSVQGLAAMFENLEVKDFKEAQAKYLKALEKQKDAHDKEMRAMHLKHTGDLARQELRIEQLRNVDKELREWKDVHHGCPGRAEMDKARQESREAISKWERTTEEAVAKIKRMDAKIVSFVAA